MENALVKVVTNMKNMWNTPKIFYGLMNSLLDVLLRVHLAPNREAKYRSYIQKKAEERLKKDSQQSIDDNNRISTFADLPRNARRNIVRGEEYKKKRYEVKIKRKPEESHKWKAKADMCQERIDGYKMAVLVRYLIFVLQYIDNETFLFHRLGKSKRAIQQELRALF
jgi:hypothetical protein